MQRIKNYRLLLLFIVFFTSCKKNEQEKNTSNNTESYQSIKKNLVDNNATNETAALFYNLQQIAKSNILFGHQDDTKRGLTDNNTQWANEQHLPVVSSLKSDVKDLTGDYPAVYGHDFIHIANFATGNWFDYEKAIAKQLTIEAYERGGVNTYAWHYTNPVSKESFYWADSPVEAVSKILPGGSHHEVYKNSLKQVADFAKSLIAKNGELVPVIFRPYHEMDGSWFWWGKGNTTAANYKLLYQFTINYLKNNLGVRNFLYAWSPDRSFISQSSFLEFYPGDSYVDLIGIDNYEDLKTGASVAIAANKFKIVSDYAKSKNKLAALTETGLQNLSNSNWFTDNLLKSLTINKLEFCYALVWANTKDAFWTPYQGHPAAQNFIDFKNNPYILFQSDITSLYKFPK